MVEYKSIQVNSETYDKLRLIKEIDEYKSLSAVIEELMLRVPQNVDSLQEIPAFEWTVGFADNHTPDETLKVSWEELKKSEVNDQWKLEGSWDSYEATVLFKDEKGVFIRFGQQRYDDPYMDYFVQYLNFI